MNTKETKEKILKALEGKHIKKYRLIVEFVTDENIENSTEILRDTWLYDNLFSGAITKEELKEIKLPKR